VIVTKLPGGDTPVGPAWPEPMPDSKCIRCGAPVAPDGIELGLDRGAWCAEHAGRVRTALKHGMRAAYPARELVAVDRGRVKGKKPPPAPPNDEEQLALF
jgi:hypothetical protein